MVVGGWESNCWRHPRPACPPAPPPSPIQTVQNQEETSQASDGDRVGFVNNKAGLKNNA